MEVLGNVDRSQRQFSPNLLWRSRVQDTYPRKTPLRKRNNSNSAAKNSASRFTSVGSPRPPKHSPTSISRPSIFSPSLHRLDTAMKHALASPDPDELADDSIHASKRCKPHDANASSLWLDRAFKHRRSDTPPLTQETLDALNCTAKSKSLEE